MYTIKITILSSIKHELIYFTKLIKQYNTNKKSLVTNTKNLFISNLQTNQTTLSLLKSPHVNKTAWHQFKKKNYKHTIILKDIHFTTIKQFVNYLYLYKPLTVQIKITFKT